jgi:hypothetical protein
LEDDTLLTDDFLRQLINVGEEDILAGLPTHHNAKTIGSVLVQNSQWYPGQRPRERAAIISVDGGSR